MKAQLEDFKNKPTLEVANALQEQVNNIREVATKCSNIKGNLRGLLNVAAAVIETKNMASRANNRGCYDPLAGRAPSPLNHRAEELLAANRRLEEEVQALREQIKEMRRLSPPLSFHHPGRGQGQQERGK